MARSTQSSAQRALPSAALRRSLELAVKDLEGEWSAVGSGLPESSIRLGAEQLRMLREDAGSFLPSSDQVDELFATIGSLDDRTLHARVDDALERYLFG